jgi:hypothetical protein
MTGVVHGGWGFVWTAYAVTATVFILYSLSVFWRYRAERARARRDQVRGAKD